MAMLNQTSSGGLGASSVDHLIDERKLVLDVIKKRLGKANLQEAATELGLNKASLANLTRPERIASDAVRLALQEKFPDLNLAPLTQRATGDSTARTALDWYDDLSLRVKHAFSDDTKIGDFGAQVGELFSTLTDGDSFLLFLLDQKPFEMTGSDKLYGFVQKALERGVRFLYCLPQVGEGVLAASRIDRDPSELKGQVSAFIAKVKRGLSADKHDRIDVCELELSKFLLFVPGMKFALVVSPSLVTNNNSGAIASVSVPLAKSEDAIHIPLNLNFSNYALAALKELSETSNCSTCLKAALDAIAEDVSAENAT